MLVYGIIPAGGDYMDALNMFDISVAIPFFQQYKVKKAAVFGSYARGDHDLNSDIDIIVSFVGKYDLFDIIGLRQDLENVLKRPVDLLTYESLWDDSFTNNVLAEAKLIYEKN